MFIRLKTVYIQPKTFGHLLFGFGRFHNGTGKLRFVLQFNLILYNNFDVFFSYFLFLSYI